MSYPMLSYYPSQFANQSWLAADLSSDGHVCINYGGAYGYTNFSGVDVLAVTRLAIAELTDLLGIPRVALGSVRLPSVEFEEMKGVLNDAGLTFVEPEAELHLAISSDLRTLSWRLIKAPDVTARRLDA
jgi:hypothetical protein